jgi:hypothetical protein
MDICGETVDGSDERIAVEHVTIPVTVGSTGSGVEDMAVIGRHGVNQGQVPNGPQLRQGSSTVNNNI